MVSETTSTLAIVTFLKEGLAEHLAFFSIFIYLTRRIFAFTRALSWRETLFLLHVLR